MGEGSITEALKGADAQAAPAITKKQIGKLAEILDRNGINLDDIGRIQKLNVWQGFYKDEEGNAQTVDMAGISFSPKWEEGPEWPPVQPAPAPKTPPVGRSRITKKKEWLTAACIPDMQIGFFHNADGELEPIHDEAAIATCVTICAARQPDLIIFHGDNADFAELSKYRLTPAYAQTTQATIDRCALVCQQFREACPNARIIWLEGNHEARLPFFILDNAKAAFGLRQAMEPEGWPVLSMPHLCQLDAYGVEYVAGYPANHFWLNDNFQIIHGDKVRSAGSTAHMYLDSERVSTAFGHVHRRELAQKTRQTRNGPRTVTSVSFGCLCRLDGVVPSTKGGFDVHGRPVKTTENWQNGMGFIHFQPGDGLHAIDHVEILNDGWALFDGREYGVRPERPGLVES